MTSLRVESSISSRLTTSLKPHCDGMCGLETSRVDVSARPAQEDVAEFQRKCTELRRLATIQEVANPVSFALANSWTDTLKADKHHYLEHLTRCMT